MKFDFWTDLPRALCNIVQDTLTREEKDYLILITNSNEVSYYNLFISIFSHSTKSSLRST